MDKCPTCGARRPYSGMSDDQLTEIRKLRAEGWNQIPLAERFGLSRTMLRVVLKGEDKLCKSCASKRSWENPSEKQEASRRLFREAARQNAEERRGKPLTEEHKAKLREARKGGKPALGMRHTESQKRKWSKMKRGKKLPEETKRKMSLGAHKRWGTKPWDKPYRRSELGQWAYQVIKRDHATCQVCGYKKKRRKEVNAHHILSKAKWPHLALSVSNGVTLCKWCHKEHHRLNGIV